MSVWGGGAMCVSMGCVSGVCVWGCVQEGCVQGVSRGLSG